MEPVVNGLKQDYVDQVVFRLLDVNDEGKSAFGAYRLLGHPSYVILNSSGDVMWTSIGEKTREDLENQILSALESK